MESLDWTVQEAVLVFQLALRMRGKSLEGEALKLNHPTIDSEKGEKGA